MLHMNRRIFFCLLAVCLWLPFSHCQTPQFQRILLYSGISTNSNCRNFSFNVSAGQTLLVGVIFFPETFPASCSVSDSANNLYAEIAGFSDAGVSAKSQHLFWAPIIISPAVNGGMTLCCNSKNNSAIEWIATSFANVNGIDSSSSFGNPTQTNGNFVGNSVSSNCVGNSLFGFATAFSNGGSVFPTGAGVFQLAQFSSYFVSVRNGLSIGNSFSVSGTLSGSGFGILSASLKGLSCPQAISGNILPGQTVVVFGNANISAPLLNGTVIIYGNLSMTSSTVLGSGTSISVSGNADFGSSILLTQGAQINVAGKLNFLPGTIISPVVTTIAPTVQITVANYSSISGTININNTTIIINNNNNINQCVSVVSSTPDYGSTSLTITVELRVYECGQSGGLSTGAIVGISVALILFVLAVVGSVIALLIVKRRKEKKQWDSVHEKIQQADVL